MTQGLGEQARTPSRSRRHRRRLVRWGRELVTMGVLAGAVGTAAGACAHSGGSRPEPAAGETSPVPDQAAGSAGADSANTGSGASSPEGEPGRPTGGGPDEDDAVGAALGRGEPPEGTEWRVDEEGRRYFLVGIPRDASYYQWVDEDRTRIQAFYGQRFYVVDRDDETLYVRIHERSDRSATGAARSAAKPDDRDSEAGDPSAPAGVKPATAELLEFRDVGRGLPGSGQWRHGFELADMDGDGHLDLVHGPPRKGHGRPAIFLGDGEGAWRHWSEARFPREPYDYGDVAVADFNGDGHQDLALAMHVRGVRVLVNDGAGSFTPWSEGVGYEGGPAGESSVFSSRALEAVDWNGDGRPDLVALGEGIRGRPGPSTGSEPARQWSRGVALYRNEGDGTWTPFDLSPAHRAFGDSLAVGDFNGDGKPDLVTATMAAGSTRLVLLGDGESGATPVAIEGLPGQAFVPAVAAGDLDGDGLDDLVLAVTGSDEGGAGSGVAVFHARTDGEGALSWDRKSLVWQPGASMLVNALSVGDLSGAATPEIVALTKEGEVWLFVNRGPDGFVMNGFELRKPRAGCHGYHAEVATSGIGPAPVLFAGFAGEPAGLPGFAPGLATEGCRGQGSLEAWAPETTAESFSTGS